MKNRESQHQRARFVSIRRYDFAKAKDSEKWDALYDAAVAAPGGNALHHLASLGVIVDVAGPRRRLDSVLAAPEPPRVDGFAIVDDASEEPPAPPPRRAPPPPRPPPATKELVAFSRDRLDFDALDRARREKRAEPRYYAKDLEEVADAAPAAPRSFRSFVRNNRNARRRRDDDSDDEVAAAPRAALAAAADPSPPSPRKANGFAAFLATQRAAAGGK